MRKKARKIAYELLLAVCIDKKSLSRVFTITIPKDHKDTAFIKQLAFGCLRYYPQLEIILNELLNKPLPKKNRVTQVLAIMGLYELNYGQKPAHAVINECVSLAKPHVRGLLNALLRRFEREKAEIMARCQSQAIAYYGHPAWLIDAFKHAWPKQWEAILLANNQKAPMHLRVNKQKSSPAHYCEQHPATIHPQVASCVTLEQALPIHQVPGFDAGLVSVQDAAAQCCALQFDVKPGQRVLDACSAPGGKAVHLLECEPTLNLTAIEIDANRAVRIQENLDRLNFKAKIIVADCLQLDNWWDGQVFDHVLIDAPCSATGVIRRHPDIKLLRQPEDIPALMTIQAQMLDTLWQVLKPGGTCLYATCSILPQENQLQIDNFLAAHPQATCLKARQILPGDEGMDGFYFALLQKAA